MTVRFGDKPKICFLTTGLDYGGAETQLMQVAIRLRRRGWPIRMVSMLPPRAYVRELEQNGISVHSLDMRRGVPDPRAIFRLVRLLRRYPCDILHSYMVHANLLARIVRLFIHIPRVVCTAQNTDEGGRHREWAYRLTDHLADMTTQVSQAGLERYVRVGAAPVHKIRLVPNGVDTERFQPDAEVRQRARGELEIGESQFLWLAVGRFDPQKDYGTLLKVVAQVKDATDFLLAIAGDGPLRPQMEQLAQRLGIADRVWFLGLRTDIPDLMNAADAFIMSSAWEGMPMVLLEAHATGLPIVATDVGGNHEVVLHGKSGFLVEPRSPEVLATCMEELMRLDAETRSSMGLTGRKHVEEHYSLEGIVEQWESLYLELLSKS